MVKRKYDLRKNSMMKKYQLSEEPSIKTLMHSIFNTNRKFIDNIYQPGYLVSYYAYESMFSEYEFNNILSLGKSVRATKIYFCYDLALVDDSYMLCELDIINCSFDEFDNEWQREAWWSFEVLLFFDRSDIGLFLNNDLNILTFGTKDPKLMGQLSLDNAAYCKDELLIHLKDYLSGDQLNELEHLF